ncbi:chemotaxis protein CheB [Ramlibacter cellulosilyticus]|uniref:chemotaxis protein CheB n=1 Tax=Ramlibacter cellulosilyticus TaxID=2764187 RepID=UPI002103F79F|nr:chemotaxis protein CheB [Ramlibacter cellulosilyticus]
MDNIVPSHGYRKVPVVGLGGSAGSIDALQVFFSTMPAGSGLAFVVVIHLSPDHESALTDVIQRATRMRVVKVDHVLEVEPDTVYVIPPGKLLEARAGRLEASTLPEGHRGRHVVVDVLLRTLADSHGAHTAGVVLSGADSDGASGMKRVKERGGLTVAQDPDEATHGEMPRCAIATGMVDWVLPVQDMPSRILSYFRLESAVQLPPEADPDGPPLRPDAAESDLRDVLAFLRTRTNRDFTQYKRATILRRIGRRMQVNGVDNLGAYLNCLRTRPGECQALLQDLLISVTNFFRDPDCFNALQVHLPSLFQGKGPGDTVRVWVIACATGEEAYSIAILLAEYARTLETPPAVQVFATDLDAEAVQVAREGLYPAAIAGDVSEERLRRFFVKEQRGYRVRRELREMVLFAVHDVLQDPPFSRQHLVTCRNLLIYLAREAQARVFETLHFALLPHGTLFLGSSESVEDGTLFTVLDKKHRLYAQAPSTRPVHAHRPSASVLTRSMQAQYVVHGGPVISSLSLDPRSAGVPAPQLRDPPHGSWSDVHLQLLERLAPPSVLVDADYDIVHLSPSAGRFLQLAGGEPTRNLLRALPADLRIDVRAALYQAAQQQEEVHLAPMTMPVAGGSVVARLRVVPAQDGGEALFVVLFEIQDQPATAVEGTRLKPDPLARHLDAEIERLKMHLRDTVEQYEASTEELKASNEELQAMNEEMRAATEELETSREELQSINEELTTVNQELSSKVEDLSRANSDIQNLMHSTQIATVFLDRDLRITLYTPAAIPLFNLIPGDIGRPLTDMATQLAYEQLGTDARRVLERLIPVEREVGHPDGGWYLARLMPYRTGDDRIGGVVITFIDISERKQSEEMRLWLSAVVSSTPDAIISFALDGTILSWNRAAQRLFGYGAEEAIGRPIGMLDGDDRRDEHMLRTVAAGGTIEHLEAVRRRKDGSAVHVALSASPIQDETGRVLAGTALVRDVTEARAAAEALRQSEERLRLMVESAVEYAIFSLDLERRVTRWNSGAQRLLGWTEAEVLGRPADIIFTPEEREAQEPEKEARTARVEGRAADERIHVRRDGSRFRGSGMLMLMRSEAGEAVGFVKILRDLGRAGS